MRTTTLFLGLCLLLGVLGASEAKDVDEVAQLKTWFPDQPTLEFLPGKLATVVIGVRNAGKTAFNLSAAVGNLAHVSAPEGNIFNFSGAGFKLPELSPGEEAVVDYPFFLPINLPPRDFILQIKVLLTQDEMFSTKLVFNETISIMENYKLIDTELLGLYAILLAGAAAAAYGLYTFAINQGWVKKARKTKASGVTGAADKSEWLRGTAADPLKKAAAGKQT